jgi:hypothetical protein
MSSDKKSDIMRRDLLMMMKRIRIHAETLTNLLPPEDRQKHEKVIEDSKKIESKYSKTKDILR